MKIKLLVLLISLLVMMGCGDIKEEILGTDGGSEIIQDVTNDISTVRNVFIIMGQSNASSDAASDSIYYDDNIFVLNRESEFEQATQALDMYSDHIEQPPTDRVKIKYSFGWSFGKEYIKTGRDIYLISNAKGGTRIDFWEQGGGGYDAALERMYPYRNKISAILYHQGESDCHISEQWKGRAVLMVSALREDLGYNVPFFFGQLSQEYSDCYLEFNEMLLDLPSLIDNVYIIKSDGASTQGNGIHFDMEGQKTLGVNFYKKFVQSQILE